MTSAFSAAVKLADLDDFLSPAQSCILPLLDSRGNRQNVVNQSSAPPGAAVIRSPATVDEATVRSSVSHPSGHGRLRKSARYATKQEITQLPGVSNTEILSSPAAALYNGAVLSSAGAGGNAVAGTASPAVLNGDDRSSTKTGHEKQETIMGYGLSSTHTRPSLIKLGESRFSKESVPSSLTPSAAVAKGGSRKRDNNNVSNLPPSSSSDISSHLRSVTSITANEETKKQVARVALYDCLACKGCVTSSEAILIERHSIDEFLKRTRAAIPDSSPSTQEEIAASATEGSAAESPATIGAAPDTLTAAASGLVRKSSRVENASREELEGRVTSSGENVNSDASTGTTGERDYVNPPPRLVVVSISPQSLTALQQHFGMTSAAVTLRKLSSLFRLAGATHVMHTAVGDALSVLEVEREFIERCREAGIGGRKETTLSGQTRNREAVSKSFDGMTHEGASEIGSARELHMKRIIPLTAGGAAAKETATTGVSATERSEEKATGIEAAGVTAATGAGATPGAKTAGVAGTRAAGLAAADLETAGEAAAEVEEGCVVAGGTVAEKRKRHTVVSTYTARGASRQFPEEQAVAEESAGEHSTIKKDYGAGESSRYYSDTVRFSDVRNSSRREHGKESSAERNPDVSAPCLGTNNIQSQQQQLEGCQQEQQQVEDQERYQRQQHNEEQQEQHNEEQQEQHNEEQEHNEEQLQEVKERQQNEQELLNQQQHKNQQPEQELQQEELHQQQHVKQQEEHQQHDGEKVDREVVSVLSPLREKTRDNPTLPLFASFCPGFVCYAETSYDAPLLLQHMSRVRSGQQIQGILVKGLLLELHNAASFVLRLAALNAAQSHTGIAPLLLQLLLRKSVYASPRCRERTPAAPGLLADNIRKKHKTIDERCSPGADFLQSETVKKQKVRETENADTIQAQAHNWQHEQRSQRCFPANTHSEILSLASESLGAEEDIRPEDVFHVCIMPCFDKKLEAARPEFKHPTSHMNAAVATPAAASTATSTGDTAAASVSTDGKEASAKEGQFANSVTSSINTRSSSSSTGDMPDNGVVAADVDLVLATNEVPVLLQRMNVRFEDLPESYVDTLLHAFFPTLRREITTSCSGRVSSPIAAATTGRSGEREAGSGIVEVNNDVIKREEIPTKTCCSSNKSCNLSSRSPSEIHKGTASLIYTNTADRPSALGYVSSAVCLLPRLRSLVLSPLHLLLRPATAVTPYVNSPSRWMMWSKYCFPGNGRRMTAEDQEGRSAGETAATEAETPLTRLCTHSSNTTLLPQGMSTNVVETGHTSITEGDMCRCLENANVHENYNDFQEHMSGSGGYAERVFRRAAKDLFCVNVEGPLLFQKRKKRDEGYKEAVLVIDGEEKLRVALAYGFKNIQNVVQKLRRQQRLATTHPASTICAAPKGTNMAYVSPTLGIGKAGRYSTAAVVATEQQDMQVQPEEKKQAQRQQEEEKQLWDVQQKQGAVVLRSVPHFLEVAACPGGCLGGGGQKLGEGMKEQSASSSSCSAVDASPKEEVASESSSITSAARKNIFSYGSSVEHVPDGLKTIIARRQQHAGLDRESSNKNSLLCESESRIRGFVREKQVFSNNGKGVFQPDSAQVSPALPASVDADAKQERTVPDTGQAKPLEKLTALLHESHVYCEPLQRAEVQLAYLYLLSCAERADKKRLGEQRKTEREGQTQQGQQQQLHHVQVQKDQHSEHREMMSHLGNLQRYAQTVQTLLQAAGEKDKDMLSGRQEAQDQQQSHEDHLFEQQASRKEGRLEERHACSDSVIRGKRTTEWTDLYGVSSCLSTAGGKMARMYRHGVTPEGLTCDSSSPCGEKYFLAVPSTPVHCATTECAAIPDPLPDTATMSVDVAITKSVVTHPTNTAEIAFMESADAAQFFSLYPWWDAFGENRTAVRMLRTRFRDIWGGKKDAKQLEKGDAAVSGVSSPRPALHRGARAKPSLHW